MLGSMAEPVASTLGLMLWAAWLTEFGTARNLGLTALFMLLNGLIINALAWNRVLRSGRAA